MSKRNGLMAGLLMALGGVLIAGCAQTRLARNEYVGSRSLLFGSEASAPMATQIGRSEWPATDNGYHTAEDSVFVEYYYDVFGGNQYSERNTPQRYTYSYRVRAASR